MLYATILYYTISYYTHPGSLSDGRARDSSCCSKAQYHTGVSEKNTPPDKRTGWKISFESTKSGAGLQFRFLGRMAKARAKGMISFTDTGSTSPRDRAHRSVTRASSDDGAARKPRSSARKGWDAPLCSIQYDNRDNNALQNWLRSRYQGNHLSNATCLTHVFFKRGDSCSKL